MWECLLTQGFRFALLRDQKACEQMDSDCWLRCCGFFKRDPTLTGLEHTVTIPGMRRPLMPHQAYCIYWQLQTERSLSRGGFVGDGMGLGKVGGPRRALMCGAGVLTRGCIDRR